MKNGADAGGTWQVKCFSDAGIFGGTLQLARDGYVEISFDAQWKFPHLQGHGAATLAGWIDGDSAGGRMRVEGLTDGRWTATRKP